MQLEFDQVAGPAIRSVGPHRDHSREAIGEGSSLSFTFAKTTIVVEDDAFEKPLFG